MHCLSAAALRESSHCAKRRRDTLEMSKQMRTDSRNEIAEFAAFLIKAPGSSVARKNSQPADLKKAAFSSKESTLLESKTHATRWTASILNSCARKRARSS